MRAKFINELWDKTISVPYTKKVLKGGNQIVYLFDTDKQKYFISFTNYEIENYKEYQIDFGLSKGELYTTINKGDIFAVANIIVDIMKTFINSYNPDILHILPKNDYLDDTRRFKIIKDVLSKHFSTIFKIHETIHPGTKQPALVLVKQK